MKKDLFILKDNLKKLGFKKESDIIKDIIKIADSRNNMVRLLKLTEEEANFFYNLSTSKGYNIARWFSEWRNKTDIVDKNDDISFQFLKFTKDVNIKYDHMPDDDDEDEDVNIYNNVDFIIEVLQDDSFYRKIKNKNFKEIFEDKQDGISMYEFHILKKFKPGITIHNVGDKYTWYDIGTRCIITSSFLNNCGSIGDLGPNSDIYDINDSFTMLALKDKNNRPKMVITTGECYIHDFGTEKKVIINASVYGNKTPNDPDILKYLFDLAREREYYFANIYQCTDEKGIKEIEQEPGINSIIDKIRDNGFELYSAFISEYDYTCSH
jgi:hypothetical protein